MAWYNYLTNVIGEIIEVCVWSFTIIVVTAIIVGRAGGAKK